VLLFGVHTSIQHMHVAQSSSPHVASFSPCEGNKDIISPYKFDETNDTKAEIIIDVQHQMAIKAGEIIEVDSESDSDSYEEDMSVHKVIQLCEHLEKACIKHSIALS
jgi:hypothetical protein